MNLKRMIQTVGMKTFVKYYYEIKNYNSRLVPSFFEEDYTDNSKITKLNTSKRIFKNKLEVNVLKIISQASNVPIEVNQLALKLLKEELSTN